MSYIGTNAFGLRIPIIKQGDNITDIVFNSIYESYKNGEYSPKENDIIGLTESIVARASGKYITIDNILDDLSVKFPNCGHVYIYNPIFSRNRFSVILRAFARHFDGITIISTDIDEVGNTINHDITKVNYFKFYKEIVESEGCEFKWNERFNPKPKHSIIDCTLHTELFPYNDGWQEGIHVTYLKDICNNISEYGLLGSNKVDEETLKLFPDSKDKHVIDNLKEFIQNKFKLSNVHVMVYGDGCYKDATSGIWEFADPVVSPIYTEGLEGTPSELKLKYLADDEFKNLTGDELTQIIKKRISSKSVQQGQMQTQGTTPRQYTNLLGSLMDLISGSGDKGTPVVIVQNYFKDYSMD